MSLKESLDNVISKWGIWLKGNYRRYKYFRPVLMESTDFIEAKPFNYYDSPYPDIVEIHKHEKELFDRNKEVIGIDFNIDRQLELVKKMETISLPEWPTEKSSHFRFYYNNTWFTKGCAEALYYMIRIAKPKRIIEIGSGFSTAVMLDTNEYYFKNKIKIISVEPYADRLKMLLKPTDNIKIYERDLQKIPYILFEKLDENDILFIDSSHVSKMNSDVNYIFFEILPRLKKGVYIHFHDITYPFIYPEQWIYEGRVYNEMYILRAFLMNNGDYKIQLFGDMLQQKYKNELPHQLIGCGAGSIWIQKMR